MPRDRRSVYWRTPVWSANNIWNYSTQSSLWSWLFWGDKATTSGYYAHITTVEGVVQYELRHILSRYLSQGYFTFAELNAAIASHNYGFTEVADKSGPLRESVFHGNDGYKLKYKAAQARLFLRFLPFILSNLCANNDRWYNSLITELIEICQIVFSPVISLPTINLLKLKIGTHLASFREYCPNVNIMADYMIHVPRMIKELGPLVRHSCFAFESAHNYFKELARK